MSASEIDALIDNVRKILIESDGEPPAHLVAKTLQAYVDGALDPAERELVESHLDDCPLCSEDVGDLAAMRRGKGRIPVWRLAAAAAVIPILAAALLWLAFTRGRPPNVNAARRYENAEWQKLVTAALREHHLQAAAIAGELRGARASLRGDWKSVPITAEMRPAGVVIDTVHPNFTWPVTPDASYILTIVSGDEDTVTVGPLHQPEWRCDRTLVRGRTYTWQVETRPRSGPAAILPPAADTPAMFHIASQSEHDVIATATAHRPKDHLLLAVLLARSGMESEAKEEIRRLAAERPRDLDVRRLVSNTLGR